MAKKQKAFTYANPDKTTYTYNADNQMVSAVVCEGNLTKRYTYKYDANGNLTQECLMNYAETTYQYLSLIHILLELKTGLCMNMVFK